MSEYAVMPLQDYKDTCDKIREKTTETEDIKSGEVPQKIETVYEAGQKSEYDRFWDNFQSDGNRRHYTCAFGGTGWTDEIYNPKYDFGEITYASYMFYNSKITDTKKPIDISKVKAKISYLFTSTTKLKTIRTITISENTVLSNSFLGLSSLREISFNGIIGQSISFADSSKLTHESLMSIVNALKNLKKVETLACANTDSEDILSHGVSAEELISGIWKVDGAHILDYDSEFNIAAIAFYIHNEEYENINFDMLGIRIAEEDVPYIKTIQFHNITETKDTCYVDCIITLEKPSTETRTLTLPKDLVNITAKELTTEIAKATEKGWTVALY